VSDPIKGICCKKNKYVSALDEFRDNTTGRGYLAFGIKIKPSQLSVHWIVHSGNVARKLGLILRKQNETAKSLANWMHLRKLDPHEPVKLRFCLIWGWGV